MPAIAIDARMIRASGIGVVLDNVLRRLVSGRPDWNFLLLGTQAQLTHLQAANVRLIAFDAPIYSIREQRLALVLAREGCDLVWSPHYNIPLLWRGPLMVTVHDLLPLAHPELFSGIAKQSYARFMFGQVRRRAWHIAFVSKFTADEFTRLVGPPHRSTSVIHNGVNQAFFRQTRPRPHTKPYVLFVGNIKQNKNLRRLVMAFQEISDRVPHDLVLVGRKEGFISGESGLETITQGNPRIVITGEVDGEHLAAYYAHAAALAMPSYYEGFGLPPLEAMAAGCPVLAAEAASMPEICGDAALYFDPWQVTDISSKLFALLTDHDLRVALLARGVARLEMFNWDKAAAAYLEAMEGCLSSGGLSAAKR